MGRQSTQLVIDISASDSIEEAAAKLPIDAEVVLCLCGNFDSLVEQQIRSVLARAVVPVALSVNALVVDDGSCSGLPGLMGEVARTFDDPPKLLGILSFVESLPEGKPGWIIRLPAEWQNPEKARYQLISEFAKSKGQTKLRLPVAALVAGGGDLERSTVLRFVRRGWPVLVLQGAGGWGDLLLTASSAAAQNPGALEGLDPELREIVENGRIAPLPLAANTDDLTRGILSVLEEPGDVLEQAWKLYSRINRASVRHEKSFRNIQNSIIYLMILPTFLAIAAIGLPLKVALPWAPNLNVHGLLHILAIIVPIIITTLVAYNSRIRDGNQWILLQAAGESIKHEIFRYRTRTGEYTMDRKGQAYAASRLAATVKDISANLAQSEANRSSLPSSDDDDVSPENLKHLSPQRYLHDRVIDQIANLETKTKRLHRKLNTLQLWILITGGLGTFVSAIRLEAWMALTTAFATAFTNKLEMDQVQRSLKNYNISLTNLRNIEAWWTGLSLWERTRRSNFELLVDQTERALGLYGSAWVQQMQTTLTQLTERETSMIHKFE